MAYILGAGEYFYPDFPKCGMPGYEDKRCIAEACKHGKPIYKECKYFQRRQGGKMVENKKSAKDIAFDKERVKFRKEIRQLTGCLDDKQKQIDRLKETIREKETIISQQKEWIDRLLEYTELSEDDMKKLIKKEKITTEIVENFSSVQQIFRKFGSFI